MRTFTADPRYSVGLALFNEQRFFEAHEVLEDVWRESSGEARLFLQGVVQAAVGLHHLSQRNLVGASGVLSRAIRNLSDYPEQYGRINVAGLREALAGCLEALAAEREPVTPRIERDSSAPEP